MPMKHVQAELSPHEYAAFQKALEEARLTVKQGAHEAIMAWVRKKRWKEDPIWGIIGIAKTKRGARDASRGVDEIYDED